MISAQWLETFLVLCEAGHFTRAAGRLNMTQSGVSQQLRKLELQIGQALITRDGKGFILTPTGEVVLDLAKRRRTEERQLRDALDGDDAGQGQVSVACSGSLAMLIYPRIIRLMRTSPGLTVQLEAAPQARVLEGVLSGSYDIGVADHQPTNPRLACELIGSDQLCVVLPRAQAGVSSFADLEQLGFIAHPDGLAYADELLSANFPNDYQGIDRLNIRSFINQIGQIPTPIAEGVGYTILPRSGVDYYPRREALSVMTLAYPIRHELWLVRRRGKVMAARVQRIVTEVIDAVGHVTELS
jgi:DNA-binding transcriptional LysR family regulator